jgi:hypothetical protein
MKGDFRIARVIVNGGDGYFGKGARFLDAQEFFFRFLRSDGAPNVGSIHLFNVFV